MCMESTYTVIIIAASIRFECFTSFPLFLISILNEVMFHVSWSHEDHCPCWFRLHSRNSDMKAHLLSLQKKMVMNHRRYQHWGRVEFFFTVTVIAVCVYSILSNGERSITSYCSTSAILLLTFTVLITRIFRS